MSVRLFSLDAELFVLGEVARNAGEEPASLSIKASKQNAELWIVERARGSAIAFRQQRRRLDVQGLADVDERAGGNTIGTLFRISESAENVTPISLASFSCETPSSRRLARTRAPIRRSASDAERASPLADLAIPTAAMSTQRYIGEAPETEPKVERSGARIEFQPRSAPSARVRTSSTTR